VPSIYVYTSIFCDQRFLSYCNSRSSHNSCNSCNSHNSRTLVTLAVTNVICIVTNIILVILITNAGFRPTFETCSSFCNPATSYRFLMASYHFQSVSLILTTWFHTGSSASCCSSLAPYQMLAKQLKKKITSFNPVSRSLFIE